MNDIGEREKKKTEQQTNNKQNQRIHLSNEIAIKNSWNVVCFYSMNGIFLLYQSTQHPILTTKKQINRNYFHLNT